MIQPASSAIGKFVVERAKLRFVEIAEHILRVAEQKRWRPIETAPKDRWVLGWQSGWSIIECCWTDIPGVFTGWHQNYSQSVFQPTHWMPKPKIPEEWQSQYHEQPKVPEVKS